MCRAVELALSRREGPGLALGSLARNLLSGRNLGSIDIRLNRNMVRLKSFVTLRKQRIGVVFNRNKIEGNVVVFFRFLGSFLGLGIAFSRPDHGCLRVTWKSASISRLERRAGVCFL